LLLLGGKLNAILRREHERECKMPLPASACLRFFCDGRPGESFFLSWLIACVLSGAPAYAQVSSSKTPQTSRSFTEPGQITTPSPSVAEEKKATAKKTVAIKEKEESEGVAESLPPKKKTKASATPSPKKSPSSTPVPPAARS